MLVFVPGSTVMVIHTVCVLLELEKRGFFQIDNTVEFLETLLW